MKTLLKYLKHLEFKLEYYNQIKIKIHINLINKQVLLKILNMEISMNIMKLKQIYLVIYIKNKSNDYYK